MNHTAVCYMWAAHNMKLSAIHIPKGRGGEQRTRVKSAARGSRISFSGDTIKSFHWWPMARFVANDAGDQAVIFRNKHYSSSTSQHQSTVRAALRKYAMYVPVFDVDDDIDASHGERVKGYMRRIRDMFDLALKARAKAGAYIETAAAEHTEMLAYAAFFKIEIPMWANPFASPEEAVAFEAKLTELSLKTGVPINAFWRRA